jgi:hypothetical protein
MVFMHEFGHAKQHICGEKNTKNTRNQRYMRLLYRVMMQCG